MRERLQKVVARAGIASRRASEELISAGRVRVNGRVVTELGTRVDAGTDRVEVDGRRVVAEPFVYIVLNKPRAVVSTLSDPEQRPTVRGLIAGVRARIFPVGRLDFHTSGVLLLTNDGAFSNGLLHPRRDVPKTYVAKLNRVMTEADRLRWEQGVELDDGKTRPAAVRILREEQGKTWITVTLHEGRNQQIRRMAEATGYTVMRLSRTQFAGIDCETLRPGRWRELSADELQRLQRDYGVPQRLPHRTPRPASATPRAPKPAGQRTSSDRRKEPGDARRLTRGRAARTPRAGG